jgi:hypothetical protein
MTVPTTVTMMPITICDVQFRMQRPSLAPGRPVIRRRS